MLAPAALVTAVVVAFGFVAGGGDPQQQSAGVPTAVPSVTSEPTPTPTATESADGQPAGVQIPKALVGPRPTLKPKPKPKFRVYEPFSFTIASFNVLGHSHTKPGGNKRGWAGSAVRTSRALNALNGHSVDVVGLQEFQAPQLNVFQARGGGTWDVYPGMSVGRLGVENSIAWRQDIFRAIETHTISIPYFGGRPRLMPYVLLEHLGTGQQIWVANFHNPADTRAHGRNFRHRRSATQKQIALANQLSEGGLPVFFTGDFNERAEFFCPFTGNTTLKAANGGSTGSPCAPPARMQVDWVFGSDHVEFSGYRADKSKFISSTTDHPLVAAEASIPERKERIRRKKG